MRLRQVTTWVVTLDACRLSLTYPQAILTPSATGEAPEGLEATGSGEFLTSFVVFDQDHRSVLLSF